MDVLDQMLADTEGDEFAKQAIKKMKECITGDSDIDDKVDEYVAQQHAVQEMLKENTETQRQAQLHYQQKAKTKSAANKRDGETPADGDADAPTNGPTGAPAAASPPKKKRGRMMGAAASATPFKVMSQFRKNTSYWKWKMFILANRLSSAVNRFSRIQFPKAGNIMKPAGRMQIV